MQYGVTRGIPTRLTPMAAPWEAQDTVTIRHRHRTVRRSCSEFQFYLCYVSVKGLIRHSFIMCTFMSPSHGQGTELFHHREDGLCCFYKPHSSVPSPPRAPHPQPQAAIDLFSISKKFSFQKMLYKWNHTVRNLWLF